MTPNFLETLDILLTSPEATNLNIDFNVGLSTDIWLAIIFILIVVIIGNAK